MVQDDPINQTSFKIQEQEHTINLIDNIGLFGRSFGTRNYQIPRKARKPSLAKLAKRKKQSEQKRARKITKRHLRV